VVGETKDTTKYTMDWRVKSRGKVVSYPRGDDELQAECAAVERSIGVGESVIASAQVQQEWG
jgi:hypothetical protein